MNKYSVLKEKHRKEINDFPLMFAFSQKQFAEGMEKLGLKETDTDQIISIGAGGYMRKSDEKAFDDILARHEAERKEAVNNDTDGTGYILDMFSYELSNHEYCYTGDISDTLDCLGYTREEIKADAKLLTGLNLAIEQCKYED
jgi:hypothetical protein